MFTAEPGRRTQAEAEGQAVHPPAWLGVRSLSPDRPHRLLPPCRGLIQAWAASEQSCLAEGRVGMVWNFRCLGGWGCRLCNCLAVWPQAKRTASLCPRAVSLMQTSSQCPNMFILVMSSLNIPANHSRPWPWEGGGGNSWFQEASFSVGGLIFYCHIRGTRKENIIKPALPGVGNPKFGEAGCGVWERFMRSGYWVLSWQHQGQKEEKN